MGVVIRIRREGKKNAPKYRIVVTDSKMPRDGRFIEILGSYDPIKKINTTINRVKFDEWVKKGAKPSDRVASILRKI